MLAVHETGERVSELPLHTPHGDVGSGARGEKDEPFVKCRQKNDANYLIGSFKHL